MKHGPIALVDERPLRFVRPRVRCTRRRLRNMEEVRARHGRDHRRRHRGDASLESLSEIFLPIPDAPEIIQPLLAVVPLQLLAYHVGASTRPRHRQAAQPGQERDGLE